MDEAGVENLFHDGEDFLAFRIARQSLEERDRIAVDLAKRKLGHIVADAEQRPQLFDVAALGGFDDQVVHAPDRLGQPVEIVDDLGQRAVSSISGRAMSFWLVVVEVLRLVRGRR